MPNPRPFTVDPVLTGIAIGYRNSSQSLIADQVLPRTPVLGETFKWLEYPLAEGFTLPDTRVGRRGRVNRVEFSATERSGSVHDYGLDNEIPQTDIDAAAAQRRAGRSNYDPENHAAESLTNLIMLDREVRVAGLIQDPASYAPERRVVLAASDRFDDYENSDPIEVIKEAIQKTLIYRPNTMVMGMGVWSKLSSHPALVNAIRGNLTNKGIISRDEFKNLFEIKDLLIGESFVNTARKGQSVSLQRTWGNSIELLHIDPMARADDGRITFGLTAQLGNKIAGRMEDPNIGLKGGRIVRVGEQVEELIIARDVGVIIQNAIS